MGFVLSFLSLPITQAQDDNVIINKGEITIYAKPNTVWKVLTDTKKYSKIMGYKWKSGKKNVDTVGDQAELEFSEMPTSYELTFIEPGQKLSIKLTPSTSEYINEKTWSVIPVNKWTTKVKVEDIYILPSSAVPPTLSEQVNSLQKTLQKLRSVAERS